MQTLGEQAWVVQLLHNFNSCEGSWKLDILFHSDERCWKSYSNIVCLLFNAHEHISSSVQINILDLAGKHITCPWLFFTYIQSQYVGLLMIIFIND